MHSSRMRTGRSLIVWGGLPAEGASLPERAGLPAPGVGSPCWGASLPRGVSLSGGFPCRGVSLPGGVLPTQGGLPAGGASLPGGFSLPGGPPCRGGSPCRRPPLLTESQTREKNITLATTSLRPVKMFAVISMIRQRISPFSAVRFALRVFNTGRKRT